MLAVATSHVPSAYLAISYSDFHRFDVPSVRVMHARVSKAVALTVVTLAALAAGCARDVDEAEEEELAEVDSAELVTVTEAQQLLYAGAAAPSSCATGSTAARVECLVGARYASDPSARSVALSLFRETGGVAGVLPAETYDGGFRGDIRLVPALPTGTYRKHVVRVRDAMRDIDDFFVTIASAASAPLAYRWREVHRQAAPPRASGTRRATNPSASRT